MRDYRHMEDGMRKFIVASLVAVAGCSGKSTSARTEHPTARVQESTLAASKIPGAKAVGAALRISDSADARRQREDSISRAVP